MVGQVVVRRPNRRGPEAVMNAGSLLSEKGQYAQHLRYRAKGLTSLSCVGMLDERDVRSWLANEFVICFRTCACFGFKFRPCMQQ